MPGIGFKPRVGDPYSVCLLNDQIRVGDLHVSLSSTGSSPGRADHIVAVKVTNYVAEKGEILIHGTLKACHGESEESSVAHRTDHGVETSVRLKVQSRSLLGSLEWT